jgi:hypothetical protein
MPSSLESVSQQFRAQAQKTVEWPPPEGVDDKTDPPGTKRRRTKDKTEETTVVVDDKE